MTLLPGSSQMATALKSESEQSSLKTCASFDGYKVYQPHPLMPGVTVVLADNEGHYTGPGTNTYVVGRDRLWVLDPGPASANHCQAIITAVDGRRVDGILVTHSQLDHSPGAALLQEKLDAPIYGYGQLDQHLIDKTDEDIDPDFIPDRCLKDGDYLANGDTPLVALHTPGHYPNHLAFHAPDHRLTFTGDHIMGWATTVVIPPLGNLQDFMKSLLRLSTLDSQIMLPSHGPIISDPHQRCFDLALHRRARHVQIENALKAGHTKPKDIVAQIYKDLPTQLRKAAIGQVRAHLDVKAEVIALCDAVISPQVAALKKSA